MVVCRRGQKRRLSRVWAEDDDMEDIIVIDAQQAPSSPPLPPGTKSHTVRRLSHDESGTVQSTLVHLSRAERSQRGSLYQLLMSATTADVAAFKASRTVGEVHNVVLGLVQTKAAIVTRIRQQIHQASVNTPEDIIRASQYDTYYYFFTRCVRRKFTGHIYVGHNYGRATSSTNVMYKRLHQRELQHARCVRRMTRPLDHNDVGVWLDNLSIPARGHPDVDTFFAFEAPKEMSGFEAGLPATVEVEAFFHHLAETAGLTFNKYGISAGRLAPRPTYVTETLWQEVFGYLRTNKRTTELAAIPLNASHHVKGLLHQVR